MKFTLSHIEQLKKEGRIRGIAEKKTVSKGKIVTKVFRKRSKEKEFMESTLLKFSQDNALQLISEHRFHELRKWRFDWAIPEKRLGFEYEGLMSKKSRHTTVTGYSKDSQKYNEAAKMGWRVFRYTALTYQALIKDLNELI